VASGKWYVSNWMLSMDEPINHPIYTTHITLSANTYNERASSVKQSNTTSATRNLDDNMMAMCVGCEEEG
jgi:hypothetical protein